MPFLHNHGIVRVAALQHASSRHDAVLSDGGAPQNDHVAADPGIVADFHWGCKEFVRFHAAGNPKIMVVIIDFRVRADLDAFPNRDFLHAGDADAVSQGGVAADFQDAVSGNRQSGTSVGADTPAKAQSTLLCDNHFRVWRKALNTVESEMASVKKLHRAKLNRAKKNTDQIK